MITKQIRAFLRIHYPNCIVRVSESRYSYIHQDGAIFERRELPAVDVEVESTLVVGTKRNGRNNYHRVEAQDVIDALRLGGFCAEFGGKYGFATIIDAPKDQWPVNTVYRIGDWHN